MADAMNDDGPIPPRWIRRPGLVHVVAYAAATLVFAGQIAAVLLRGSELPTVFAVLIAGVGVALSWWRPWEGLVLTAAASFAVTAVGEDPLSVWMMAVLVLFSFTFRGRQPIAGTLLVAAFFLAAFMTVGGLAGGAVAGAAALFSAIAGGATGSALRIYREHWLLMDERTRHAIATREIESTRRVTEERLRIARDLHDVVGHQVAMLSVHLGVAEIGLPPGADSSREALGSARSSARSVVVETQRILVLLRRGDTGAGSEALLPTPSVSGLAALIASFESIGLRVEASIAVEEQDVAPGVGVTLYRVVQECLTNAYRHGEGEAIVVVGEAGGRIRVLVSNRVGHALPGSVAGSGLGLVGMRERVEAAGGQLSVDTVGDEFRIGAEFGAVVARGATLG